MAAFKALLLAALVTVGIFFIIIWIIPIMTFALIFILVAAVAYVIFKEDPKESNRPWRY